MPQRRPRLHLEGIVGQDFTPQSVRDWLAVRESGEVEIHLNSGGGLAFAGVGIFNALRDHEGEVTIVVDGVAASAASLIAMAGDRVIMHGGSLLMLHDP